MKSQGILTRGRQNTTMSLSFKRIPDESHCKATKEVELLHDEKLLTQKCKWLEYKKKGAGICEWFLQLSGFSHERACLEPVLLVMHWNRPHKEVLGSPPLEVFQRHVDVTPGDTA